MATLKEVAAVMAFLGTIHPEKAITPDMMRAYHLVLYDVEPDRLKAAALQLASTSKWYPKPSEIRRCARTVLGDDTAPATGEEAWAEVMAQVYAVGHVGKPEFSSPRIGEAVNAIGGWRQICVSNNTVADRAHFMRVYDKLQVRDVEKAITHPALQDMTDEVAARLAAFADTRLFIPDTVRKGSG